MTREEAIKMLKYNSNVIHKTMTGETDTSEVESLDMAIKALEQEEYYKDLVQSYEKTIVKLNEAIAERQPSEDCVSRLAVLEMIEQIQDAGGFIGYSTYSKAFDVVDNMSPVTPTRKKGKWIKVTETDFGIGYECSECGRFILTESIDEKKLKDFPYCHCGAEMESKE